VRRAGQQGCLLAGRDAWRRDAQPDGADARGPVSGHGELGHDGQPFAL